MPGGIRPRIERLTSPEMKKFVSDAVAAEKKTPSKDGDKLLAALNKQWATVLKSMKEYDVINNAVEAKVKATVGKAVEDPAFDEAQAAINASRRRLAVIAAELTKFEKAEADIRKRHRL